MGEQDAADQRRAFRVTGGPRRSGGALLFCAWAQVAACCCFGWPGRIATMLLPLPGSICVFVILMLLAGCSRISDSASLICHACVSDRLHSFSALASRQFSCRSEGLAVAKATHVRQAPDSLGLLLCMHLLGIPSYLSIPMDGLHIDVSMGSIGAGLVPH